MSGGRLSTIVARLVQGVRSALTSNAEYLRKCQVGFDHLGNRYFEDVDGKASGARRGRRRWILTAAIESDRERGAHFEQFDADVPQEWQSWLQNRRVEPPTQREIDANMAMVRQKRDNAAKLAQQRGEMNEGTTVVTPGLKENDGSTQAGYPQWSDLERYPGESRDRKSS